MVIKIAHLYYDLMNLYGENGNVKALVNALKNQEVEVQLDKLSIDDNIDFEQYDCFIIGCGTESNLFRCLSNLHMHKDQVKKSIEAGKFFLCTGNSLEMFGKVINDIDGNLYNGLNVFGFDTSHVQVRTVSEILAKTSLIDKNVIGFMNSGSKIGNYDFNLFEIVRGTINSDNKMEGIHNRNFYGTGMIGPILVRNPELLKHFVTGLIMSKDKDFSFKKFGLELSYKAYSEFMDNHYPAFNIK